MAFVPFTEHEFRAMENASESRPISSINWKVEELRRQLGTLPEFDLDFFKARIARRPEMRGRDGLVFGPARWTVGHWFLFNVGGDQDQVQLNIGMWPEHLRVGLGFQIGRQVAPKIPAFQVFQTFLGVRPPLPFRDAFYRVVKENGFRIEDDPTLTDPGNIIYRLETQVIPADGSPVFVFIGALWSPDEASVKGSDDIRSVFLKLLPFYEALILVAGRCVFPTEV